MAGVAAVFFLSGVGRSDNRVWVGGGGNSLWSTAGNWEDLGTPTSSDSLHFGGTFTSSNNNLLNCDLSQIVFDSNANSFSLQGNTVTFSGLSTITNRAALTQTIGFSGPLLDLEYISALAGTLVINSTVSNSGAGLSVSGGAGKVVFNQPLLGLDGLYVTSVNEVQFNNRVSTTVALYQATVVINSATQLPGANIGENGTLKMASDVTLSGPIYLEEPISQFTPAPAIDTNGFFMTLTGGLRDGGIDLKPARLRKLGQGVLTVSGDNTLLGWSGGTTIEAGTLRAGTATAFRSGTSFTLADTAGATLDLNHFNFTIGQLNGGGNTGGTVLLPSGMLTVSSATSSSFGGAIVGGGSLTKAGAGVLTLTGANSYTGGTTVTSGTLKGDGRGLQGNITNNAAVVFDQTGTGTYAGNLSGVGTVRKTGTGILTLSGNNTFSGGISLEAGTLAVATTSALGLVGDVTVADGTLKGDGSPRTITARANYTQSGGTLALTLYGAGAGQFDRLSVANNAAVGGTLSIGVNPGFLPVGTSTYSILNASSLGGTFDFHPTGAALQFEVAYSSYNVVLTSIKTPYVSYARTGNEQAVGNYMDSVYPSATGDLALVMGELNALPEQELGQALKSISPQPYQTLTTVGFASLSGFSQRVHSQLARARLGEWGIQTFGSEQSRSNVRWGSLTAEAGVRDDGAEPDSFFEFEKKWGAFLTGDGLYATLPGNADVSDGTLVSGGFTTGIDYRFSPQWILGFGIGYAQSTAEMGSDEFNVDGKSLTPGFYGSYNSRRYYLDALAAYQSNDYVSKRKIVYGTQDLQADASPSGHAYAVGLEAGRPFRKDLWDFVPMAGLQMAQETVGAFQESGAGPLSLAVGSETRESLSTRLGVRVQRQFTPDKRDRFEVRTAWRHEFKGETNINASFAGSGGNLSVAGSAPEGNSLILGGDLSASFSENLSLLLAYDGDFGGYTSHRLHGGIRLRF